nr:MAG TPA: hypothetical protein [Caudoviricetes sp.]
MNEILVLYRQNKIPIYIYSAEHTLIITSIV